MSILRQKARLDTWLDRLYRIPNQFNTLEEFEIATHQDLADMTLAELKTEMAMVKMRLLYDKNTPVWLIERLDAIKEAINHA